mmetsp:Transcript_27296/g.70260  ORF Transcript_27296/g.70260 Transcript_27296/m.70260 type:complete len:85 (-) Transcript_27296:627-881(-)
MCTAAMPETFRTIQKGWKEPVDPLKGRAWGQGGLAKLLRRVHVLKRALFKRRQSPVLSEDSSLFENDIEAPFGARASSLFRNNG